MNNLALEFKFGGSCLATSSVRVLVVDDFEPFRRFISSTLRRNLRVQVICEVSDGQEAVQKAEELQPDLVVLDIGLPKLNGIEAARRIRRLSPNSKILFVTQESSATMVQEALATGARGYVVKADAGSQLSAAVSAVLRGGRFVGSRFADCDFTGAWLEPHPESFRPPKAFAPLQLDKPEIIRSHKVDFYADDARLLNGFTQFIEAALKTGNPAIVVATESHRDGLLARLQARGLDLGAAIEQGRYVALDAAETLSTFTLDGQPDRDRFLKVVGDLLLAAARAAKTQHPRIAACGECAPVLRAQGKAEAAIQLEYLWDEIARSYDIDILCGYCRKDFQGPENSGIFQRICAVHSAVHA